MIKRGLIIAILILISGCSTSNVNCVVAGCSDQVCTSEEKASGLFTTCEFKEEYSCFQFSECGFFDGECKWEETDEYLTCLEGVKE